MLKDVSCAIEYGNTYLWDLWSHLNCNRQIRLLSSVHFWSIVVSQGQVVTCGSAGFGGKTQEEIELELIPYSGFLTLDAGEDMWIPHDNT
jgi:hypothetical protein